MNNDLNPDDIIKIPAVDIYNPIGEELFHVSRVTGLLENLGTAITRWGSDEGVPCSVLKVGEGWKSGKIRIKVEFIPDSESSI